jgi:hypothetical protein
LEKRLTLKLSKALNKFGEVRVADEFNVWSTDIKKARPSSKKLG